MLLNRNDISISYLDVVIWSTVTLVSVHLRIGFIPHIDTIARIKLTLLLPLK